MDEGFSGKAAAEIVGITYRQLDYWARTDLVRPTLADAKGSGSRRKYSYRDLLELKLIKTMLDSGIKLESVRDAFEYLRTNLGGDITSFVSPRVAAQVARVVGKPSQAGGGEGASTGWGARNPI